MNRQKGEKGLAGEDAQVSSMTNIFRWQVLLPNIIKEMLIEELAVWFSDVKSLWAMINKTKTKMKMCSVFHLAC